MAGSEYSGLDLGTVIRLSVIILFNNDQRNRFDLLVSGESLGLESMTLVFSWLQNGHFIGILLLKTTCYLYGYYKRISS